MLHALLEWRKVEAEREKKSIPVAYYQQVPLHPAMFLAQEPFFKTNMVLNFLSNIVLHVISL